MLAGKELFFSRKSTQTGPPLNLSVRLPPHPPPTLKTLSVQQVSLLPADTKTFRPLGGLVWILYFFSSSFFLGGGSLDTLFFKRNTLYNVHVFDTLCPSNIYWPFDTFWNGKCLDNTCVAFFACFSLTVMKITTKIPRKVQNWSQKSRNFAPKAWILPL